MLCEHLYQGKASKCPPLSDDVGAFMPTSMPDLLKSAFVLRVGSMSKVDRRVVHSTTFLRCPNRQARIVTNPDIFRMNVKTASLVFAAFRCG
jgi:hypothetical protein